VASRLLLKPFSCSESTQPDPEAMVSAILSQANLIHWYEKIAAHDAASLKLARQFGDFFAHIGRPFRPCPSESHSLSPLELFLFVHLDDLEEVMKRVQTSVVSATLADLMLDPVVVHLTAHDMVLLQVINQVLRSRTAGRSFYHSQVTENVLHRIYEAGLQHRYAQQKRAEEAARIENGTLSGLDLLAALAARELALIEA